MGHVSLYATVILAAVLTVAVVGEAPIARAGALTVGSSANAGPLTLRQAIEDANSNPGPDVITFDRAVFPESAPAAIALTSELPVIDATAGITIDGTGAGVIISGPSNDPALVFGPEDAALSDITVRGVALRNASGGMHLISGSVSNLVVDSVSISGIDGFGIFAATGDISGVALSNLQFESALVSFLAEDLSDVTVTDSTLSEAGIEAAVNSVTDMTVRDTVLSGRPDRPAFEILGGEVVTGLTFDHVTAEGGFSLIVGDVTDLVVQNSSFSGGGLSMFTGDVENASIDDNTISGGVDGIGFISNDLSSASLRNNTITDSDSGIFLVTAVMNDVTIDGNTILDSSAEGMFIVGTAGVASTIAQNTIMGSGRDGILIAGARFRISRNSIFDNEHLGIDLVPNGTTSEPDPGVTHNDAGDTDQGGNDVLNFPVFALDVGTGGVLDGTACNDCTIEVFKADEDPSGHGEGVVFLGDTIATSGSFFFELCGVVPGDEVTATATDALGNTSEFALNYVVDEDTPACMPANGDLDCDGDVGVRDGLVAAIHDSGANQISREPGCPEIGSPIVPIPSVGPNIFGDVNCDGEANAGDLLPVLQHAAGVAIQPPQPFGCLDVGSEP